MAAPMLRIFGAKIFTSSLRISLSSPCVSKSPLTILAAQSSYLCNIRITDYKISPNDVPVRHTNFFMKYPADQLWNSVTGVSNAGRKRGRGRRTKRRTDLNRGQRVGEDLLDLWRTSAIALALTVGIHYSLSLFLVKSNFVPRQVQQRELPPDPSRQEEIIKLRDKMSQKTRIKVPALQRGWAGSRWPGMSIGPPEPIGEYKFEGFDTKVLEFKMVANMTGTLGRKQRFSAFVVTGNKRGIAGFGLAKAPNGRVALKLAKNRAAQKLRYIELFEEHTVYHSFYEKFHKTGIFVNKKHKGHGVVAHRCLKAICEMIGIKNIECTVEGASNYKSITKAMFQGLAQQETHEALARRQQLHVVEFRPEMDNMPLVLASPDGPTRDIGRDEDLDIDRIYYGGRVRKIKPPKKAFYEDFKSYKSCHFHRVYKIRNQRKCMITRLAGTET